MLTFTPATSFTPGTLYSLLVKSYADILDHKLRTQIRTFDKDVFTCPDTVGACTFVSCLDTTPVGCASYDPRPGPDHGLIGHNCILPAYQGKGYGSRQIREVLRILKDKGFRWARVTTGEQPFFLPAQKMYQACGFTKRQRRPAKKDTEYGTIEYEIDLTGQAQQNINSK